MLVTSTPKKSQENCFKLLCYQAVLLLDNIKAYLAVLLLCYEAIMQRDPDHCYIDTDRAIIHVFIVFNRTIETEEQWPLCFRGQDINIACFQWRHYLFES